MSLQINNLSVSLADGLPILDNFTLEINPGEVHVLMGPNGSGKSSLAKSLLAHPDYEVTSGSILVDGSDLTELETTDRAKAGLFLAHQYPVEVPGLHLTQFLRMSYNSLYPDDKKSVRQFRQIMREYLPKVGLEESFMDRNLNEGFSGGEKKKCEILQMLILNPKYVILDETDSGLDIDATGQIFTSLSEIIASRKEMGVLIITHYHKVLEYIEPGFVHVMISGQLKASSTGKELADKIEKHGYAYFTTT